MKFQIFSYPSHAISKICRGVQIAIPKDRITLNQKILTVMAAMNILPCNFQLNGKQLNGRVSLLRSTCWKCQLSLSVLYALYINFGLILTVSHGLEKIEPHQLGTYLTRAMLSATFSFWAYQIFETHHDEYATLYNFAQSSPGKPFISFIIGVQAKLADSVSSILEY